MAPEDSGRRESTADSSRSLLILGLGNVLCSDDGLGVVAVHEILRHYEIPERVRVLDGGTLGLALLSFVQESDDLILVDAVRAQEAPGSLVRLVGSDVPPAVRERLSVHQIGVSDLLDALRLLGRMPPRLVLLGLVPATLELGMNRSPAVENRLPELVERTVAEAAELGHRLRRRVDDAQGGDRLSPDALAPLGL